MTELEGGWRRVSVDGNVDLLHAPVAGPPESVTALVELRAWSRPDKWWCGVIPWDGVQYPGEYTEANVVRPARDGQTARRAYALADASAARSLAFHVNNETGGRLSFEYRLSLYEGDYKGPYVPYVPD